VYQNSRKTDADRGKKRGGAIQTQQEARKKPKKKKTQTQPNTHPNTKNTKTHKQTQPHTQKKKKKPTNPQKTDQEAGWGIGRKSPTVLQADFLSTFN